jgi:hypothetical protein
MRNLIRLLVIVLLTLPAVTLGARGQGASVLQRFLAKSESPTVEYRAFRHLEAHNMHFGANAWLDAWTEYTHAGGFKYEIVNEGGNGYVRTKVLRAALVGEQRMWAASEPQKASLTVENYEFREHGLVADGLAALGVKARRKDVLLIDGRLFVQPEDGELTRIEGKLSKTPSFWTRQVEIIRRYERVAGVRVPVSIESVAHVLIAGRSTFTMTYQYESINGQLVGTPSAPHPSSSGPGNPL